MKLVKTIFKILFLSAIPATLSYLSNSTLVFDKLIAAKVLNADVNISLIQDWCLWVGISFSSLFLSLNLIITKGKFDRTTEERDCLIKMAKTILASSFVKKFFPDHVDFDMRIFVPKYQWLYSAADRLRIKKISKKFVIKNINLIADQGITKDLQFEVSPQVEGLVGQCYIQKQVLWDDNLEATNSMEYNLGKHQISRTADLKWCICCPIYGNANNVVAILALDGKTCTTISKSDGKSLAIELTAFSRLLFDSVPKLFKR